VLPGAMPTIAESRAGPGTAAGGRARRGSRTHPDASAVGTDGRRPRNGDRKAAPVGWTRRARRGRRWRLVVHRRDAETDARAATAGRRCGECRDRRAVGHRVTCGDRGRRGLRWRRTPGGPARFADTTQRPDPLGRADRSGTAKVDDAHRRAV